MRNKIKRKDFRKLFILANNSPFPDNSTSFQRKKVKIAKPGISRVMNFTAKF